MRGVHHERLWLNATGHIKALCKQGSLKDALQVLKHMDQRGIKAYADTYLCLLQECINMKSLADGKWVHKHMIKSGFKPNIHVGNTLVNMYCKCGRPLDAREVFDGMPEYDVFSWTAMIRGYILNGHTEEALSLFQQIGWEDMKPDRMTFMGILKACASVGALEEGKRMHERIISSGLETDVSLGNSLVDMYAKCGDMDHAFKVFNRMPVRDVISWNTMITGYAKHGKAEAAFKFFKQMELEGVEPERVTFLSILRACASLGMLERGKQIHDRIRKSGLELDFTVGCALVDMYAKCGSIEYARQVFDRVPIRNVVSWTAMLAGYVQHGHGEEALRLYWQMQEEGVAPNQVTLVRILNACAILGDLVQGKQIHTCIVKNGLDSNSFIGNSLVDMYAKCGSMDQALQVFEKLQKRDVIAWTAMISGYAQHGNGEEAMKFFWQMQRAGIKPNEVTFLGVLKACSNLADLELGKQIHIQIIDTGFESDMFVRNSLIDMYGKCGDLKFAHQIFDKMQKRDAASWNALIAGYAQHGHGKEAFQLVAQMQQEGLYPDRVTFLNALCACSHAGLVDEGCQIFKFMTLDDGAIPILKHYSCMVDLLGRAGRLKEAEDLIERSPCQLDETLWVALLGACRVHGNMALAVHVAKRILDIEPTNSAAFVLLSNIYAASGRWKTKLTNTMQEQDETNAAR